MFKDFENVVEDEIRPLMEGYTFTSDLDDLDIDDLGELFALIQFLEAKLKDRKTQVRALLLEALENAPPTAKGGTQHKTLYGTAIREKRESKLPDEESIKILMANKGIPLSLGFSPVKKTVLDISKINDLIERGKLKREEVESARSVSYALKFKPNARTSSLLDDTIGVIEG